MSSAALHTALCCRGAGLHTRALEAWLARSRGRRINSAREATQQRRCIIAFFLHSCSFRADTRKATLFLLTPLTTMTSPSLGTVNTPPRKNRSHASPARSPLTARRERQRPGNSDEVSTPISKFLACDKIPCKIACLLLLRLLSSLTSCLFVSFIPIVTLSNHSRIGYY